MKIHPLIAVIGCLMLLGACAPKAKTQASDAELLAKMSNNTPMQIYAMCSANMGRGAMLNPEKKDIMMKASALYFEKAVQLSSLETATQAMTDQAEKYSQVFRQNQIEHLQLLATDMQTCNAIPMAK